jgi:putative methylase
MALRIAAHASSSGYLKGSVVADLASGTCRLSLAALMMGASRALAVDFDYRMGAICLGAAETLGLNGRLAFVNSRLGSDLPGPLRAGGVDVALANPPFGVARRGADWEVLGAALRASIPRVYAILKEGNIGFHSSRASRFCYKARLLFKDKFPIPDSMPRHRSRVKWIGVEVLVFEKRGGCTPRGSSGGR